MNPIERIKYGKLLTESSDRGLLYYLLTDKLRGFENAYLSKQTHMIAGHAILDPTDSSELVSSEDVPYNVDCFLFEESEEGHLAIRHRQKIVDGRPKNTIIIAFAEPVAMIGKCKKVVIEPYTKRQ